MIKYRSEYYRENREKILKANAKWRKKHRIERNAYNAKYRRNRRREDPKWRENQRKEAQKYNRKYRAYHALYDKTHQNTLRVLARRAVFIALDGGHIVKPKTCEMCFKKCSPQAHHPNYRKPLSVIWVCSLCHAKFHWKH